MIVATSVVAKSTATASMASACLAHELAAHARRLAAQSCIRRSHGFSKSFDSSPKPSATVECASITRKILSHMLLAPLGSARTACLRRLRLWERPSSSALPSQARTIAHLLANVAIRTVEPTVAARSAPPALRIARTLLSLLASSVSAAVAVSYLLPGGTVHAR